LNVPPPIVGIWDHSSFTNSETAGRWFATYSLGTWARKIQAEFRRSVLSRGSDLVIDLSDHARGNGVTGLFHER
jgi:phage portal protein BeeE